VIAFIVSSRTMGYMTVSAQTPC